MSTAQCCRSWSDRRRITGCQIRRGRAASCDSAERLNQPCRVLLLIFQTCRGFLKLAELCVHLPQVISPLALQHRALGLPGAIIAGAKHLGRCITNHRRRSSALLYGNAARHHNGMSKSSPHCRRWPTRFPSFVVDNIRRAGTSARRCARTSYFHRRRRRRRRRRWRRWRSWALLMSRRWSSLTT